MCCGESNIDLVTYRRHGAPARPAVPEKLHQPKTLSRLELRSDRHPPEILTALRGRLSGGRSFDDVVHPRSHPQAAFFRGVDEHYSGVVVGEELGTQGRAHPRAGAGIVLDGGWQRLVCPKLR